LQGNIDLADILKLSNITKTFDGIQVMNKLDLSIEQGSISSIIGPNGAGKSTLFNIICGYLNHDSGNIFYKNADITNKISWKRASMGIGRLFQDIRIFKKLTLLENLLVTFQDNSEHPFKAVFHKKSVSHCENIKIAIKWLNYFGLKEKKDEPTENLSWGQQKLLSFARLLCGNFELLLIDEPVSGISPELIHFIIEKIKELRDFGKTIIIVEHDMQTVEKISDLVHYMEAGKIVSSGLPADILNNHKIIESYMGRDGVVKT